jgi:putative ABC transport system permease protein
MNYYQEIISSALQSLQKNKLRTALTMLGIIIGITSVILIASLGQGSIKFITNELSVFGTNYFQIAPGNSMMGTVAGSANPLTRADAEAITEENIANVQSVAPFAFTSRKVSANDESGTVYIYGLTSAAQAMLKPDLLYGEFIGEEYDESRAKVAVIGTEVAEEYFGEDTNPVGESLRIENDRYRIIGVSKTTGTFAAGFMNKAISVPLNTVISDITGKDELIEIDISVENEDLINQTIEDVDAFMRDRHNLKPDDDADFNIQSFIDILSTVQTVTGLLTTLIAAISGISLIVGGVGVMNIMLVSVTERTREIGLLKAIGAKQKDILMQFLLESMVMTIIGGLVGISIGISGAFLISILVGIPFVLSLPWIVLAVAISSIVGIVFGLYPARRAAKLSPIDALRHE